MHKKKTNPSKDEIKRARASAGLTQTAAGALLYVSIRGWQCWEGGERKMHPAFWELFLRKIEKKKRR